MPDSAGAVDHVGHPPGQDAERRRDPVALADLAPLVAEQREREIMVAGESGMLADRVRADPDYVGAGLGERLIAVAEGARLLGAAGSLVLGVEVQDDYAFAVPVAQPDRLAGLGREDEVGSPVSDLDAACHGAFLPCRCQRRIMGDRDVQAPPTASLPTG